jgi:hypothetical protein
VPGGFSSKQLELLTQACLGPLGSPHLSIRRTRWSRRSSQRAGGCQLQQVHRCLPRCRIYCRARPCQRRITQGHGPCCLARRQPMLAVMEVRHGHLLSPSRSAHLVRRQGSACPLERWYRGARVMRRWPKRACRSVGTTPSPMPAPGSPAAPAQLVVGTAQSIDIGASGTPLNLRVARSVVCEATGRVTASTTNRAFTCATLHPEAREPANVLRCGVGGPPSDVTACIHMVASHIAIPAMRRNGVIARRRNRDYG